MKRIAKNVSPRQAGIIRRLIAVAGAILLAATALAACSSDPSDQAVAQSPQPQAQQPADDSAAAEDADVDDAADAEDADTDDADADEDCIIAMAGFGLTQVGLEVRTDDSPLTQKDIDQLFGDTDAYVDKLSTEAQANYQKFRGAMVDEIGKPPGEVSKVIESDEMQSVIKSLDSMTMMMACL